jgi:hypothetical protein
MMHRTKLPLTAWFWAAHLMATHSNGMSAQQLMGQLGLGSYKTAWLLAQKLRRSMLNPQRELLKGVVEVDQSEMPFRAAASPSEDSQRLFSSGWRTAVKPAQSAAGRGTWDNGISLP